MSRISVLLIFCAMLSAPCIATVFGEEWSKVRFGLPLPDGSSFLVDEEGIWAIGLVNGLSFSKDAQNWSPIPGLPEDAFAPEAFLKVGDSNWVISYRGFWNTASPDITWTNIGAPPIPTERLDWEEYLLLNGRVFAVGGDRDAASSERTEVWSSTDGTDWRLETAYPPYTDRRNFGALVFKNRLWVLPGEPSSLFEMAKDIWSSADGIEWRLESAQPPWAPRAGYASSVFKDRIFIVGGGGIGDVWSSADGVDWRQEPVEEPYLRLAAQMPEVGSMPGTFVWDDYLYVVGGRKLATWRTPDGVHWDAVPNSNPWAQSSAFASVVFKGKLYMLGGENDLGVNASVWRTPDGEHWEELLRQAPWPVRRGHAAVVKDGYIWIFGGASRTSIYSDVWRSPDGVQWEEVTASAAWEPRYFHGAASYDGHLWLAGGLDASVFGEGAGRSDVWRSEDGIHWEEISTTAGWGPSFSMGMAVHNDALWIVGGTKVSSSDIDGRISAWTSTDGAMWTQVSSNLGFGGSVPVLRSYAGKLWFSGGLLAYNRGHQIFSNALWSSDDGVAWAKVGGDLAWLERNGHGMEFLGNRLVLWGGADGDEQSLGDIWLSQGDLPHQTADVNGDLRLSLSEVLRLIQLYNASALHSAVGSEDGFAPGPGDTTGTPHQSDYNPQDWKIDLSELLRAIQFYNAGGYTPCQDGEDGFCLGE